ncbi:TIGR04219 family outer membrane beta-barrel protein [Microbulbifer agarilyticus]|uniref:TIGR04219 family outer membrane beta-barrel protein n=1 Tax=Microbulbifer agarilyticus TaxID=260552 RepID=UPI001C9450F4|nr:TIGR04219 family outer membrane beta-barrel protein [Microbulbifer agarilyticus]MBY6190345.1 TIGR04219 family outer membrane beta-barrel protein [Microbulbifer agarilyticus]
MKKTTLTLLAVLASTHASADTLLGVDTTIGSWTTAYEGSIDGLRAADFFQEESNITIQIAVEHPVPYLPNILVAHNNIETIFEDGTYDMDLSHTDATLYYEVLDNWLNLDLGLTARNYDGRLKKTPIGLVGCPDSCSWDLIPSRSILLDFAGTVPMAYLMAEFELPVTGLSIIAQGNGTNYRGDTISELTAKVRWDFVPTMDFALEAGYRGLLMDSTELDELNMDFEATGPYFGLSLRL